MMTNRNPSPAPQRALWTIGIAVVAAALVAGCGDGPRRGGASQTAAKVNRDEITVHQINYVLQQQRGVRPEQADAAAKQILERLIEQQLAVQRASELKIDRDPRVVMQLEAARREILARAYLERVGEAASKPTPDEVRKYYEDNPALFSERRIYSLQEIAIEAKPEQIGALRDKLSEVQNIAQYVEWLRANGYKFAANQAARAAEQLPLASLKAFASLRDGQAVFNPAANGAQVIVLAGSTTQPVDLATATPAIEQFLVNERKRNLVQDDLKALRAQAKIEYVGKFAEAPPPAADAAASGISLDASKEPAK